MTIHKEGHTILAVTGIILAAINTYLFYSSKALDPINIAILVVSIIFFLIILQFFRFPNRKKAYNDDHIIAPSDGKVVVIEEVEETEYFKDKRIQISIFMSPLNVHAQWYPMSGKINYMRYHKGKYLVAWHPKSSTENERTTIVLGKGNKEILVRQVAGVLARRIIAYGHEGDMVRQGADLGFIKFGSRLDVYVPADANVKAYLGQKVKGSVSILAEI